MPASLARLAAAGGCGPYLDGLHRVVLVQFVNVVGYAGVERGGRDRVDDGGVVGLLLVSLAVGVDEQREKAAEDGAAEPHGNHVEQAELWGDKIHSEAPGRGTRSSPAQGAQRKREGRQGRAPDSFQNSGNHRTPLKVSQGRPRWFSS